MKKKNKKQTSWIIIGGVAAVALISLLITLIIINNKEKENPKKNEPNQQEKKKKEKEKEKTNEVEVESQNDEISEDEIIAIYGMSKNDAEAIIKKYFTTDDYEFSTRITAAGFYRVSVKDKINNDVLTFRIDPASKSAIQE